MCLEKKKLYHIFVFISALYCDKHEISLSFWEEVARWARANGYAFDSRVRTAKIGPSYSPAPMEHPMNMVTWYDVVKWCNARTEKEGRTPVYYKDTALTQVYRKGDLDLSNNHVNWFSSGYRLPTEAEWESAAQGNFKNAVFPWGDELDSLNTNANTWQGNFPIQNESLDGFESIAPVKSYPPNSVGVYDMVGNVWEITADLFNVNYYSTLNSETELKNLKGATTCYNPANRLETQYVMKGGSFLCHDSYCASFRISARMGVSVSSGSDHAGFRTVATPEMLLNK